MWSFISGSLPISPQQKTNPQRIAETQKINIFKHIFVLLIHCFAGIRRENTFTYDLLQWSSEHL
jgi:hypothetical protein